MTALSDFSYEELRVGQIASFEVNVSEDLVSKFAVLSGDENPMHCDTNFSSRTEYGGIIAHGMIAGMFFSRLIGMYLPGKRSIYLSQKINFHRPIFPGTSVCVSGEISQKVDSIHAITLQTTVREKASRILLVDGQALVRIHEYVVEQ